MGFNNAGMIVAANAIRAAAVGAQLHSAAAGDGTANLCSSSRVAVTWAAATSDGDFDISAALNFTGGAANGTVYSCTLWSTSTTGGTCYGEWGLTGDTTFNSAGEYQVTSLLQNGSST